MDDTTACDWLLLSRLPETGPARLNALLDDYPDPSQIAQLPRETLLRYLPAPACDVWLAAHEVSPRHPLWQRVLRDLDWLQHQPASLVVRGSARYPLLLSQIHQPPPVLWVHGDPAVLALPQLAMVGSRHASADGRVMAGEIAQALAASGMVVTSGLALGIDAAAHEGALGAAGLTVAVVATGLDTVYPARHRDLAQRIIHQGGAIISEFPLGTAPQPEHFPRRNRLISGLSIGVTVVEAAIRSGSLITARYALEQDRDVFAVPGSVRNPRAAGCHALIKQGATLVENADDILLALGGLWGQARHSVAHAPVQNPLPLLTPEEQRLVDALGFAPVSLDELHVRSGQPVSEIAATLVSLEVRGVISRQPDGFQRCERVG